MLINKYFNVLIFLFLLPVLYTSFFPGKVVLVTVIAYIPLFLILINKSLYLIKLKFEGQTEIKLFLYSNLLILLRGLILQKGSADFGVILQEILPTTIIFTLVLYFGLSMDFIHKSFNFFILTLVYLLFIMFLSIEKVSDIYEYSRQMSPLALFIVLSGYCNLRWKLFILVLALCSIFSDITIRAVLLNIIVAYLLSFLYYIRYFLIINRLIKTIRFFLFLLPFVFITLAITGVLNVFQVGTLFNNYVIVGSGGSTQDVLIDSRTSIYTDVFMALKKDNAYIFGLGGGGRVKTSLSDITYDNFDQIYKNGRPATESGMLNYIQWGGIVGAFFYFLLLLKASYLAIYKSNNFPMKLIGLWVSYKFFFSFIEDRLVFSLNTFFLMLIIGMCFNENLRKKNDIEFNAFFQTFFKRKFKIGKRRKVISH